MSFSFETHSREETISFAKKLASFLLPGDLVLLEGDLGAGKTTLVSGVAAYLGINEKVISPTFNILKCYFKSKIPLYHIDAYRLENQNMEIGLDEYIEGDGIGFVGWPIYIESLIPDEYLRISITHKGGDNRGFEIEAQGEHYQKIMEELSK